ncbi:hypothetical protein LK533_05085 [Sphingomonas sp. PL-96]|uniref:hypothetical protein n=1 Tax=Sphingomonas sp. PL-96 TaxID=2887201 RepID=UPI001E4D2F75|nr:hypothetical protein [Sphingomonas sp. PL-96]MCC2976048.1 hypothetical protein [Sphingomonas sp. PL-96]
MKQESAVHLLWGIGALTLVISALAAQRPDRRTIGRSLLAWAIIGTLILIAVLLREELGSAARGISGLG